MARTKYKQMPLFWYCTQYDGTNQAEMVAFCPQCIYADGRLAFMGMTMSPTDWILEDQGGIFSMMVDSQFVAFFQLDHGPGTSMT